MSLVMVSSLLFSCEKTEKITPLDDGGQKILRFVGEDNMPIGGQDAHFTNSAIIITDYTDSSMDVSFKVEYLGPQVFGSDVTVNIGEDDEARVSYNSNHGPEDQYLALPDSVYTLKDNSAIIKAGGVFSSYMTLTIYPNKIDPASSYMLPITISGINGAPSDVKKAPATGTVYFHLIGNPLAGVYNSEGWFYHPASPRAVSESKLLLPLSPTKLLCDVGDLGAAGYVAIFEIDPATNKVTITSAVTGLPFTQFDDGLPSSNPGYTPQLTNFPDTANYYDPATKTFYVRYGYVGGTGWRVTEEVLTKP